MGKKQLQKRLTIFLVIISLIFSTLFVRLAYIQLVQTQQYKLQSEQNRIRMISIPPRRGDIITSDGHVLATSYAAYSVVVANLGHNMDYVYEHLIKLLAEVDIELTVEDIKEAIQAQGFRRYEAVPILRDVPFEVVNLIKERQEELPGIDIEVEPRRVYPNDHLAGHILGYVMEIRANQLEQFRQYDYRMGDPFGQAGIERVYEYLEENGQEIGLRGQKGVRQVEVNVANRPIRELLTIPAVPGNNLKLTIDYKVQRAMEEALETVINERAEKENPKANAGAAVAINPQTGAILGMASYPTMNPNDYDFINGLDPEQRDYYADDKLKPGFNRTIQGAYPPGSAFKVVTGLAAVDQGINPKETVYCGGGYPNGIRCLRSHGPIDYFRALAVSCNTYFQSVAVKTGPDRLAEVAREFGLGKRTGIILPGEQAGLVPSPSWKNELNTVIINNRFERKYEELDKEYQELIANATVEEKSKLEREKDRKKRTLEAQYRIEFNFHTKWQDFDTYNTSIGQGSNNYTVLQLANLAATIGNGGYLYQPYLVDSIMDQNDRVVKKYEPTLIQKANVSKEAIEATKEGMLRVGQPGGTVYSRFYHFPSHIQISGKTGTAQTGLPADDSKKDYHGVFIGFAPYENPEIAWAVIVEYGGGGGASAGKVAQQFLEEFFGLNEE